MFPSSPLISYVRQHTDGTEGLWLITGSESWPGHIVLTDSEETQLTENMMTGLRATYAQRYYTLSNAEHKFDANEFRVHMDDTSMSPDVLKFYEIQIGRERYCGMEHCKEHRAADAYIMKHNIHGRITLFAVQIQYFIRHRARVQHTRHRDGLVTVQDEWHTFAVVLHYRAATSMDEMGQDVMHPNNVAFTMDVERIGDRYGCDNFVPIRVIAGRFVKVPSVPFKRYVQLQSKRQLSRPLDTNTGFYASPLPRKL